MQKVIVKAQRISMSPYSTKILLEKNWLRLKDICIVPNNPQKIDEGTYCTDIIKTTWREYSYE